MCITLQLPDLVQVSRYYPTICWVRDLELLMLWNAHFQRLVLSLHSAGQCIMVSSSALWPQALSGEDTV